jgi:hypothetical protein
VRLKTTIVARKAFLHVEEPTLAKEELVDQGRLDIK